MRRSVLFVTAAIALVAVPACKVTSDGAAAGPSGSTSAPAPVSVSASPSASGIPTSAMLQPADLNGAAMKAIDGDTGEDLRPPRPCGDAHPTDSARVASTAMTALYPSAGGGESTAPSVILQTIARYRPGSGSQAFGELVAAVARCPGEIGSGIRSWENLGPVTAGDEAVLFKTSTLVNADDHAAAAPWSWPFAVARVGDDLVLVADLGWETMNGDEVTVKTLIAAAVQRARATK
jgi:hypothetical protein